MTDWVTPSEGKLDSHLARSGLDTNWCPTPILAGSPLSDGGATVAASWTLWASFAVLATISVLAVILVVSGRFEPAPLTETQRLRFRLAIGTLAAVAVVLIGDWLIRLAV